MPESSPSTGELLDGRYLLDSRIGVGGMGVVYRARDETLGRMVAVKLFRDASAESARTSSETRLLAALNHASLVTLFDAHLVEGASNYLVMEYVDGPTLRERIAEGGALSSRDVAVMARDLAEALHVVHQAGIVHRDIKPSNVLLRRSHVPGEEYRAKLADFGIAYLVDSTRLTTPGTLVGTAAYLSPEQVRGAEPAPASDIYSLGLVLLESLTGDRAFPQTGTHEAALARLTRDPVIPSSVGPGWMSLLTAMTAREPEQRPTALDVVLAAGALDGGTEATETALDTALDAEATVAMTTLPTLVLPDPAASGDSPRRDARDHEPVRRSAPDSTRLPRLRRRQVIAGAIAVAAVLVVAVIVIILIGALGASAPVAPTLPSVDDPLGTHLQQLLDAVTP